MDRVKRAISVDEITKKKFIDIPISDQFKSLLGSPSLGGSWIIWGSSGNGKTSLALQLAKELSRYFKVEYLSNEEGFSKSLQSAIVSNRMHECRNGYFKILEPMSMDDLRVRLSRKRGAKITFIDSAQYTFMTKAEYFKLKTDFPDHLFIWISHAKGKEPAGALADAIRYDSDVKIYVNQYVATAKSRHARGIITKPYIIWEEGAKQFDII
jgi:uridine kinase